jgi:hypothetical protein
MVTPRPTPKPAWKAPQQSSNPIPSRQTEKEQLAKEREAKERAAQEERKRKELEVRKQFNDYEGESLLWKPISSSNRYTLPSFRYV